MILSFFKERVELRKQRCLGFLRLKTLVEEMLFSGTLSDDRKNTLWYELDNLRQDFIYADLGFFEFIENIEKLLLTEFSLKRKIASEILHKRSAQDLILQEREVLGFLDKLTKLDSFVLKRKMKQELRILLKQL